MGDIRNETQVTSFISQEVIEKQMKKLHPGMVVTHGKYETIVPGTVSDLEWGFYDELHRVHLHKTYNDMFKVFSGKYFSVNVVRWKNLPFFMLVSNAKISHGLFYQAFTVLGIIYCHQWTRMERVDELRTLLDRTWFTASHWLFKPLHIWFNRALMKVQIQQDDEDTVEIRSRRRALREKGFRFKTDTPDFINSNVLDDQVQFPATDLEMRFPLEKLTDGVVHEISLGDSLELLVKKENGDVLIWPGICPHEGARLKQDHLMPGGVLKCPWHGRKFTCSRFQAAPGQPLSLLDFEIAVEKDSIVARRRCL